MRHGYTDHPEHCSILFSVMQLKVITPLTNSSLNWGCTIKSATGNKLNLRNCAEKKCLHQLIIKALTIQLNYERHMYSNMQCN
jgi:hypothetical protein